MRPANVVINSHSPIAFEHHHLLKASRRTHLHSTTTSSQPHRLHNSAHHGVRLPSLATLATSSPLNTSGADNWSDKDRDAYTHAVLQAFLSSELHQHQQLAGPQQRFKGRNNSRLTSNNNNTPAQPTTAGQRTNNNNGINYSPPIDITTTPTTTTTPTSTPIIGTNRSKTLIVEHLESGQFDETFLSQQTREAHNYALQELGIRKRLDLAEYLFHWMRLTHISNEHSTTKLLEAYDACQEPFRALNAWRNIARMDPSISKGPFAAAALLKVFRNTKDVKSSLRVLEELLQRKCRVNQYAYNIVLRACADHGDIATALRLLEELRSSDNVHIQPDVRTYSAMFATIASSKAWHHATNIYTHLQSDNIRPDPALYTHILKAFASAQNPKMAQHVFNTMLTNNLRPNRTHYNALLYAFADTQQYDKCLDTYNRMISQGPIPDQYTIVAVAYAASNASPPDAGPRVVDWALTEMSTHNIHLSVEIATALISACRSCSKGREKESLEAAKRVFRLLKEEDTNQAVNVKVYNTLILTQIACNDLVGAWETLEECQDDERVFPNLRTWVVAETLAERLSRFDKVGEYKEIKESWRLLHGNEPDG